MAKVSKIRGVKNGVFAKNDGQSYDKQRDMALFMLVGGYLLQYSLLGFMFSVPGIYILRPKDVHPSSQGRTSFVPGTYVFRTEDIKGSGMYIDCILNL